MTISYSGATLEEVAGGNANDPWHTALDGSQEEGIAAYEGLPRAAAATVDEGDFPEILTFQDGGCSCCGWIKSCCPLPPLDEVRDAVIGGLADLPKPPFWPAPRRSAPILPPLAAAWSALAGCCAKQMRGAMISSQMRQRG